MKHFGTMTRVDSMEYKEKALRGILKEPNWINDQYMTLELAELYDKQELFPKIMRLYYGTILNGVEKYKRNKRQCG